MIPFLQFHALAATRGEGLRPEFLDMFNGKQNGPLSILLDRTMTLRTNRSSIPYLQRSSPRE